MESWVHQQIKTTSLVYLQTFDLNEEIVSVPCLMRFERGILILHPLKNNDYSHINTIDDIKASIYIEDPTKKLPYFILLKGTLTLSRSKTQWESQKQNWKQIYPHLHTYFELQERYIQPSLDKELLYFKPNQILSWLDPETEPRSLDLEVI